MNSLQPDTARLVELVHEAASSKLAREPACLDVRDVTTMTDALYICHGDSARAVEAIADAISQALRQAGVHADHVEGVGQRQWVLIDLGQLMVHVFLRERREYYNLERLWHDAKPVELPAA